MAAATVAAASSAGGAVSGRQPPVLLARPTRKLARHKCCTTCQPLTAPEFLEHLQSLAWYQLQVVHVQPCSTRAARYGQPLTPLAPSTRTALAARGVSQLFCHQAAAVDALCGGQQQRVGVVVATSTASGKSLCYNLPVLEALARDRSACALYLFPTKALAQDQLKVLRQLLESAFGGDGGSMPAAEVYDGDTQQAARPAIRERAQLLITNPDMLHQSILPFHQSFARLLGKLTLVVVDEGHAYTGVFGSHTALVLRRLRRLCEASYGSRPRFVTTSATIANPLEQAALLLGLAPQQLLLVDDDGSPHGPKQLVLWNPPLTPQAAAAAGGGEAGAVVLSRTERRAGGGRPSNKLQRDMARGLAREANAARRRGVALSPAAGVTEQEWLAAVKLGRAAGAAKAFLFGKKGHGSKQPASSSTAAVVGDGNESEPEQQQSEEQEQPQEEEEQELDAGDIADVSCLDGQPDTLPSAASAAAAAAAAAAGGGGGAAKPRYNMGVAKAALAAVAGAAAPQQSGRGSSYKAPLRSALKQPSPAARASGSSSSALPPPAAAARSALQRDIEAALPARGNFKERFGAAGTPLDQQRESPIVEMSLLLAEAVMHGLRTIAFCKSRRLCELVAAYARENLLAAAPDKAGLVKVYRGGYSPSQRRQIEADLHSGALTAVAATNALELGVDVGGLDLTLHLGFPGSVASLWQQAGRSGRRNQPSVSVYVGFDGPLDQHFMQNPQELLARPIESVQLDPFNALILAGHLCCAARELPLLLERDAPLFGGPAQLQAAMAQLQSQALLGRHPHDTSGSGGLAYCGPATSPAADISLRTIDPERFVIYNSAAGAVLEEIEANTAFYHIFDGAIYLHQGCPFIVTSLNLETRVALVRPVDVKWYTKVRDHTDIHVTGGRAAYPHTAHSALAAIAARRAASRGQLAAAATAACAGKEEQEDGAIKQEPAEQCQQCQQPAGVQCKQEVKEEEGPSGGLPAEPGAAQAGGPDSQGAASSAPQPPPPQEHKDGGACAAAAAAPGGAAGVLASRAVCESCVITVRFLGYFRVHQGRGEIFDAVDLFLPDTQFETQACYMRLPAAARRACEAQGVPFREAVHAASHALLNVMPLLLVCNPADLGTECDNPYDTRFRPERLLLYDKHPGGIGLAAQAAPLFSELLQRALKLVQGCGCGFVKGCPRCVQHLDCKNYNAVLHKAGAVLVLQAALEAAAPSAAAAADAAQPSAQ